eukprot:14030434-Alexandrium_andersonii.AAC.1
MTDGMLRPDGPPRERSRSRDPPAPVPCAGAGGAGRISAYMFRARSATINCFRGIVRGASVLSD